MTRTCAGRVGALTGLPSQHGLGLRSWAGRAVLRSSLVSRAGAGAGAA